MPRLRSLSLAWGGLAAALVVAGVAGGSSQPQSAAPVVPAPSAPAPQGPPIPDIEGPGAVVGLGQALPLPTANGRVVDVAVLGVRLRHGSQLVDVRLRYELRRGATYRMDPAREAQLLDGSGQLVSPASSDWRQPALSPAGLHPGQPRTGWVTFAMPTASGAKRIQVTLDTSPRTGQWRVTARP